MTCLTFFFLACQSESDCTPTGQVCEPVLKTCVCESEDGKKNPCGDGQKCVNKVCGDANCDPSCFGDTADGCDQAGNCACGKDAQCGDGHTCVAGNCFCGGNLGCSQGQKCSNGICVSVADTTTSAPTTAATISTTPGNIRNRIILFIQRKKCTTSFYFFDFFFLVEQQLIERINVTN